MKGISEMKGKASLKSKWFRRGVCIALGLLWLGGQLIAGPKIAAEVREALQVTDVLYVEKGKEDQLPAYELDGNREIRFYEPGEERHSIMLYFNGVSGMPEPGQRVEVDVQHVLTLYGVGAKRVFVRYNYETLDANGKRVSGSWRIPARVDYRWKWCRWEMEDALVLGMHPFGIGSDTPGRDFIDDLFGRTSG